MIFLYFRKLIQFGLLHDLIRRLHMYPIKLPSDIPSHKKLYFLYKWFDGEHSCDEISQKTGTQTSTKKLGLNQLTFYSS